MNMLRSLVLSTHLLALASAAGPALAELTSMSATSFTSSFRTEVAAPRAEVWRAITRLPAWWNDAHTWSGQASNMVLDLQAGGCWCERWGEGQSVMHGQVLAEQWMRLLKYIADGGAK